MIQLKDVLRYPLSHCNLIFIIALIFTFTACKDPNSGTSDPCEGGHDFTVFVSTTATCTEAGQDTYKCSLCDEITQTARTALGHDFTVFVSTTATCTEAGQDTYKCSLCDETTQTARAALGHDFTGGTVCIRADVCGYNYALGDTGPGGGIIFHIVPAGFTVEGYGSVGQTGYFSEYKAHYLEAAPAKALDSIWRGSAVRSVLIDPETTGITTFTTASETNRNNSIGKGRRDTQIIVTFYASPVFGSHTTTVTNTAANIAADYATTIESISYTDWFLPSLGELNLLYAQRDLPGIGIISGDFWSSSQYDEDEAWILFFGTSIEGPNRSGGKDGNCIVNAVRAF